MSTDDGGRRPIDGRSLLTAIARVYSRCRTYADTGCLVRHYQTESVGGPTRFVGKVSFITRYRRPDRWYFELTDHGFELAGPRTAELELLSKLQASMGRSSKWVIWGEGTSLQAWSSLWDSARKDISIDGVLRDLSGVSGRVSLFVPGLLDSAAGYPSYIARLGTPVCRDTTSVDGVECYSLSVGAGLDERITVLAECDTLLIRRILRQPGSRSTSKEMMDAIGMLKEEHGQELKVVLSGADECECTEDVVEYESRLNGRLGKASFVFNPPSVA